MKGVGYSAYLWGRRVYMLLPVLERRSHYDYKCYDNHPSHWSGEAVPGVKCYHIP